MRRFFLLLLLLGVSRLGCAVFPIEPVWADLEAFADKEVAILWRGVHFLQGNFANEDECLRYWEMQDVGMRIYSSAAHLKVKISFSQKPNDRQEVLLYNTAAQIQRDIRGLSQKGPITLTRRFDNYRHALQHVYSNDYDLFGRIIDRSATGRYPALSSGFSFTRGNPFISCSEAIKPGACYGFGLKNYGATAVTLLPEYDLRGSPKNPFLGVLYGIVLTNEMIREVSPFSVPVHNGEGLVSVNTHHMCNILSELEVSLVGYVPLGAFVLKYPLTVPSFEGGYDGDYREMYGLTLQRFRNRARVLTDAQSPTHKKNEQVEKMVRQIISPEKQDKAGYHAHTIAEKLSREMEERLEELGVTVRSINLDDAT